jgi:hypothetical protein
LISLFSGAFSAFRGQRLAYVTRRGRQASTCGGIGMQEFSSRQRPRPFLCSVEAPCGSDKVLADLGGQPCERSWNTPGKFFLLSK